jgi:hypothetical protein
LAYGFGGFIKWLGRPIVFELVGKSAYLGRKCMKDHSAHLMASRKQNKEGKTSTAHNPL